MSVTDDALARVEAALEGRISTRIVPDLSRISDLLDLLGSPQRAYPSVHIAGTNGKTSTTRMIDALLGAIGLRTGRFTSPHLESIVERIAVGGVPLDPAAFAAAYDDVAAYAELVDARHPERLSYFELLTAMAFACFADVPVDVGVIEVGMGGRWDATSLVDAPVAVITPIDLDHQAYLGDTVEAIAAEKAAIIRAGAIAVSGPQPPGAAGVLADRAAAVGARLVRAGGEFGVADRELAVGGQRLTLRGLAGRYEEIFLPLHGRHQADNAAVALAAVEAFVGGGTTHLDPEAVRAGFAAVDSPGRLERLPGRPSVLLDAAHNPAGARVTAQALAEGFHFEHLVGVLAVLADKDVHGLLAAFEPVLAEVVVTANGSSRSLAPDRLGAAATEVFGAERVRVEADLGRAVELALHAADRPGGGVLVTGSVITVGEVRGLFRRVRAGTVSG